MKASATMFRGQARAIEDAVEAWQAEHDEAMRVLDLEVIVAAAVHIVGLIEQRQSVLWEALFTDMKYHNVGIGLDKPEPDLGRHRVTSADADKGAFKTPTLRDISKSAPYFHDGSVATLKEAVDLMTSGGIDNPNLDRTNLKNTNLTEEEKADLMEFLKTLDCPCPLEAPSLPQ